MKLSLDRTFRIVWLVVGGLLLVVLLVAGFLVAAQWLGNAGAADDALQVAREAVPARDEPRALRYGAPQPVRGTSTRIIPVYAQPARDGGLYASGAQEAWVNAIFLDDGGARLLLDRAGWIRDVRYPAPDDADSVRTWITYVMALDDSDGDGRLDHRDRPGLYVSDVEGRTLRPVLTPPLRYLSHHAMDGERILVYALEPAAGEADDDEGLRQRAFVYDVAGGRLAPYAALDSAAARAAQLLAR